MIPSRTVALSLAAAAALVASNARAQADAGAPSGSIGGCEETMPSGGPNRCWRESFRARVSGYVDSS